MVAEPRDRQAGRQVTQSLWVPGKFPGMNEMIAAAKAGRGKSNAYSRMKAIFTAKVAGRARDLAPVSRAEIGFIWHEESMRRDPDNFIAAQKFALDGLVAAKILPGDGWKHVTSITHSWIHAPGKPGVTIAIVEAS